MDNPGNAILLFDGVCNLCNGMVQFVIKRDKENRFRFASLQSDAGREQVSKLGLLRDGLTTVILIEGDKFYIKSTAALRILKLLGGPWKILSGIQVIPRQIRDFVYDAIALRRYKLFGKRDTCMVPTPELKARFL